MFHKKAEKDPYNKERQKPVMRNSICTGEKVAGFRDIDTGKFTEVMLIRNSKDMDEFLDRYDVSPSEIKNEW